MNVNSTTDQLVDRRQADQMDDRQRGIFITFEGGEGVGKTTHIRFLGYVLRNAGFEVLTLREPGGTSIGEDLRRIVLDPANDGLADTTEMLIYEAARAQLVAQVIRPALDRGAVVLCDRFTDSTIAYQAYGRGLPLESVQHANEFATGGLVPDRTLVLVCESAHDGLQRATQLSQADRIEQAGEAFHSRVNQAFLWIAQDDPERVRVVDSSQPPASTARSMLDALDDLFPGLFHDVDTDAVFFVLETKCIGMDGVPIDRADLDTGDGCGAEPIDGADLAGGDGSDPEPMNDESQDAREHPDEQVNI